MYPSVDSTNQHIVKRVTNGNKKYRSVMYKRKYRDVEDKAYLQAHVEIDLKKIALGL